MDPSLYHPWDLLPVHSSSNRHVQQQQHVVHHEHQNQSPTTASAMAVDEWVTSATKDRTTTSLATSSNPSGSVGSPASPSAPTSAVQSTLDLGDFPTLDDLTGPTSNNPILSPTSFYGSYSNYFLPYAAYTWPPTSVMPSSVPLSSYSTLNGATNPSSSASQPQPQQQPQSQSQPQSSDLQPQVSQQHSPPAQQQQHVPSSQQMMIDPSLTSLSMNGSGPNGVQHQHTFQASPNYSIQPSQPQQYSFTQHLNPYTTPYYRSAQSSAPQGTLSPQVLHSPTNQMMTGIHPSVFYAQPTPPSSASSSNSSATSSVASTSTVTPQLSHQPQQLQSAALTLLQQQQEQQRLLREAQEKKERFQNSIRPMLQSSAFTGAQAVQVLVDRISDFGSQDIDPALRLEILTKMRDGAGNHYFRAWSENATAIDITREWLKASFRADKPQLVDTIMPLLHIIDRLPLTLESLKASKLGRVMVHLVKEAPSSAIKDMASNLERRWRQIVSSANSDSKQSENNAGEDAKSKKRKLSESSSKGAPPLVSGGVPPMKKPAVGTSSSTKPVAPAVKKEGGAKASTAAGKDAKTDTSFFSAPKPKARLPSFKKAPSTSGVAGSSSGAHLKREDANVAQPSSVDPFQEVLKLMKGRTQSPAVSTPPATTSTPPYQGPGASSSGSLGLGKNGKKKKVVTWLPDGELESIRFIERAIYEDDHGDDGRVTHSLRDLDRGEGAALHTSVFEEAIDWSEPAALEFPEDTDRPRGGLSEEKEIQERREQTALGALYMTPAQIPDSPAEPSVILSEEEVDKNAARMSVGDHNDLDFWAPEPVVQQPPPQQQQQQPSNVAHLIEQLGMTAGGVMSVQPGVQQQLLPNAMMDPAAAAALASMAPEQLHVLIQQLQGAATAIQVQPPVAPTQYGQDSYGDDQQMWNGNGPNYAGAADYAYHDDTDSGRQWEGSSSRGRGGRGRGRGRGRGFGAGEGGYRHNKSKPCSFFAQGRCKYGDQCDFAHEITY